MWILLILVVSVNNAYYVHVLDINTVSVSNTTSKAWNDASLDMVETRFQVD